MAEALGGLLVVDFSRVLAGPYATMLLADLGAEVIKVERPGGGDDTRAWGPPFAGGESTYFLGLNRNKRSVALDLADPADAEVARTLAARADVVVENFRTGTMERLGLGYDALRAVNPRLVHCSITGFGADGGAGLPGYDLIVQAVGGLMSVTGPAGEGGTKAGVALVDVLTGLHAAFGVLAALRHRDATGEGQRVEVSLLTSLLSGLVNHSSAYVAADVVPAAMGNRHPSIAPYELFDTADRPLVIAAGNDRQFGALCAAVGRPELAADSRYAANEGRVAHREELVRELSAALVRHDADRWFAELTAAGVPCGPVNDLADAFGLAARLGLNAEVSVADPRRDAPVRQVANPVRLSATPPAYRSAPPRLDEDGPGVRELAARWAAEAARDGREDARDEGA
ncbi:CoA transferase [Streptomyces armeniacus]|uniref:CoA transferase n=1 Tax=Streptomyces armeniacus TaxID=83291 RepID=A0A345XSC2_9ACTN|nr:CoA transferase [Streptomyces armeniacus]AXK34538.1 CoA transferase [Streptomyces armeniacus]